MVEQEQEMTNATSSPAGSGKAGIVYVLENQAFIADVVKIGKTVNLAQRMNTLATAVPLPFTCSKASRVDDMDKVETILHETFHHAKKRWRGEFFEVEAWRVAQVLALCEEQDVTHLAPKPTYADENDINEAAKVRERRDNFDFEMLDISVGSTLKFAQDENVICTVTQQKPPRVDFQGEISTLSAAAQNAKGSNWGLQGPLYWTYEGETLKERRDRMEEDAEHK